MTLLGVSLQVIAMGLKKFGLGSTGGSPANADDELPVAPVAAAGAGASVGVDSKGASNSAAAKYLPLRPTLLFSFNPEDSNTPITGIVPLPYSHYACIASTSGQIRMYVAFIVVCHAHFPHLAPHTPHLTLHTSHPVSYTHLTLPTILRV